MTFPATLVPVLLTLPTISEAAFFPACLTPFWATSSAKPFILEPTLPAAFLMLFFAPVSRCFTPTFDCCLATASLAFSITSSEPTALGRTLSLIVANLFLTPSTISLGFVPLILSTVSASLCCNLSFSLTLTVASFALFANLPAFVLVVSFAIFFMTSSIFSDAFTAKLSPFLAMNSSKLIALAPACFAYFLYALFAKVSAFALTSFAVFDSYSFWNCSLVNFVSPFARYFSPLAFQSFR